MLNDKISARVADTQNTVLSAGDFKEGLEEANDENQLILESYPEEIEALKAQSLDITSEIDGFKSELKNLGAQRKTLVGERQRLQNKLAKNLTEEQKTAILSEIIRYNGLIENVDSQITESENERDNKTEELKTLKTEITEKEQRLKKASRDQSSIDWQLNFFNELIAEFDRIMTIPWTGVING